MLLTIEPNVDLMVSAFETPDDLGKIVRVHLVIEGMIDQLIKNHCRAKIDKRTSFWAKVNLLRATGVPEKVCVACDALNELRNQFAHNPVATIANTKSLASRFLGAVESFAPVLPKAHGGFERKKSGIRLEVSYATASEAERVIIAAAFLSGALGGLPTMYDLGDRQQKVMVSGFVP